MPNIITTVRGKTINAGEIKAKSQVSPVKNVSSRQEVVDNQSVESKNPLPKVRAQKPVFRKPITEMVTPKGKK
jgi:hypothetical protein